MSLIESRQNQNFKRWISLLDSRGIKKHQQFLLMGPRLVNEALAQNPLLFTELLTPMDSDSDSDVQNNNLTHYQLEKSLFKELDIYGTHSPILVGNVPTSQSADLSVEPNGIELLVATGDPANLGALLRSAKAFSVDKVILLKECAHPFHPKCLRASSGAALDMSLQMGPSIQDLENHPMTYTLDAGGKNISDFQWPKNLRLLLGEEGPGIPKHLRDHNSLSIPISEDVESLNAMVAAGIGLYSYRQSQSKK